MDCVCNRRRSSAKWLFKCMNKYLIWKRSLLLPLGLCEKWLRNWRNWRKRTAQKTPDVLKMDPIDLKKKTNAYGIFGIRHILQKDNWIEFRNEGGRLCHCLLYPHFVLSIHNELNVMEIRISKVCFVCLIKSMQWMIYCISIFGTTSLDVKFSQMTQCQWPKARRKKKHQNPLASNKSECMDFCLDLDGHNLHHVVCEIYAALCFAFTHTFTPNTYINLNTWICRHIRVVYVYVYTFSAWADILVPLK